MVTPNETHSREVAELAEAISVSLTIIFKSLWDVSDLSVERQMQHMFLKDREESEEVEFRECNFGARTTY